MNRKIIILLLTVISLVISFYLGFWLGGQKEGAQVKTTLEIQKQACLAEDRYDWLDSAKACYGRTKEWCLENKGTPIMGNRCFDNLVEGENYNCPLNLEDKCQF